MFNIGFGELAIICIVLIIAVGPERLPSMMKTLGKTLRTLRQASRDIRASTGIDELLREDFDLYTPPAPIRRPAPIPALPQPTQTGTTPETPVVEGQPPAADTASNELTPATVALIASTAQPEPKPISREDLVEVPAPPQPISREQPIAPAAPSAESTPAPSSSEPKPHGS